MATREQQRRQELQQATSERRHRRRQQQQKQQVQEPPPNAPTSTHACQQITTEPSVTLHDDGHSLSTREDNKSLGSVPIDLMPISNEAVTSRAEKYRPTEHLESKTSLAHYGSLMWSSLDPQNHHSNTCQTQEVTVSSSEPLLIVDNGGGTQGHCFQELSNQSVVSALQSDFYLDIAQQHAIWMSLRKLGGVNDFLQNNQSSKTEQQQHNLTCPSSATTNPSCDVVDVIPEANIEELLEEFHSEEELMEILRDHKNGISESSSSSSPSYSTSHPIGISCKSVLTTEGKNTSVPKSLQSRKPTMVAPHRASEFTSSSSQLRHPFTQPTGRRELELSPPPAADPSSSSGCLTQPCNENEPSPTTNTTGRKCF